MWCNRLVQPVWSGFIFPNKVIEIRKAWNHIFLLKRKNCRNISVNWRQQPLSIHSYGHYVLEWLSRPLVCRWNMPRHIVPPSAWFLLLFQCYWCQLSVQWLSCHSRRPWCQLWAPSLCMQVYENLSPAQPRTTKTDLWESHWDSVKLTRPKWKPFKLSQSSLGLFSMSLKMFPTSNKQPDQINFGCSCGKNNPSCILSRQPPPPTDIHSIMSIGLLPHLYLAFTIFLPCKSDQLI